MPLKTKENPALYIKDLFEIHKWNEPTMPFIFHTDIVNARPNEYGNWHESLEILQVIGGRGHILCDSRRYDMEIGDIIVINSNEVHRIATDLSIKFHCFIVGAEFCRDNGLDIKKLKYSNRIKDEKASELLKNVISEIEAEKNGLSFSVPAVRSCALSLLVYLSRFYSESIDETKENRHSDIIRQGLEYINDNFSEPLTLEAIAQKAGISKYHFLREFKQYTGYTVVTYINTLRCEYAKRLLLNTFFSVSEVAVRCGYENFSYFSKTFKKYTGILPSHFRKLDPAKNNDKSSDNTILTY